MFKKLLYVNLFMLVSIASALGQDVHLSQFYETPLLRNPALAGIFTGDIRIQAVYRNQWQSIGFPYQTTSLSGEYKFHIGPDDDYMTAGLQAYYDVAGASRLKTTQVMPAITFHKSLHAEKNRYLSAGFMAGFVQRQFDASNLTFDNQYTDRHFDPYAPTGENFAFLRRTFMDFAVGLSYNSSMGQTGNFYTGIALYHFNKPKENFLQEEFLLDPKVVFNAGMHVPVNDLVDLKAELNYILQGKYNELMLGGIVSYNLNDAYKADDNVTNVAVGAGLFMRVNDALVPVIKISYGHAEFGLSYDANISRLKTASQGRGGYELSISYRGLLSNSSALNDVRCPRF